MLYPNSQNRFKTMPNSQNLLLIPNKIHNIIMLILLYSLEHLQVSNKLQKFKTKHLPSEKKTFELKLEDQLA